MPKVLMGPGPLATTTDAGLMSAEDKIKLNNINLLGIKLNTTTLTPDTNGYVSISLMTGATSSAAGTAGLVPAPTTSNVNHYLRGDGTWNTPVVILTYGVSTYTDFINAYNAGAIIYCRASTDTSDPTLTNYPRYAALSYFNSNPEALFAEFLYYKVSSPTSNSYGDETFVYTLRGNSTWETAHRYASLRKIIVSGDGLSTSWNSNVVTLTTNAFTGATSQANGTMGMVPAPTTTDTTKFLRGDGTWATVTGGSGGSGGITGVNLVSTSLAPDANGIVTVPAMTGCSSSVAGAAGVVPAPSSGDQNKFLAGDGTWKAGGLPMVILSYGNSTWQSFIDAYNNNVIVYCRASSDSNPATGNQTRMAFMAYVNDAASPSEVEFQYYRSISSHSSSAMGDEVYIYKLNNSGTWSVTKRYASLREIVNNSTTLSLSYSSNKLTISDA